MDKIAKSILKFITSQPNCGSCFCSLFENWDNDAEISIGALSDAVKASPDTVRAAIAYLVENNLAEYRCLSSRSGPVKTAFRLKHQGLHYKEISRLTKREKWKERIYGFLSGVAVTVLGGLIIEWLLI